MRAADLDTTKDRHQDSEPGRHDISRDSINSHRVEPVASCESRHPRSRLPLRGARLIKRRDIAGMLPQLSPQVRRIGYHRGGHRPQFGY